VTLDGRETDPEGTASPAGIGGDTARRMIEGWPQEPGRLRSTLTRSLLRWKEQPACERTESRKPFNRADRQESSSRCL